MIVVKFILYWWKLMSYLLVDKVFIIVTNAISTKIKKTEPENRLRL